MFATPPADATPVTLPELVPTVAIVVLSLVQVPPAVASVNIVDNPKHTFVIPVIAEGKGYTLTVVVALQPVGSV